jgi:hypothetical protein
MIGVMMLLPDASSLRLDGGGFEITKFFFLRQRNSWRDVSDFVVWAMIGNGMVVFKAEKPRLGVYEPINAAMAGGPAQDCNSQVAIQSRVGCTEIFRL